MHYWIIWCTLLSNKRITSSYLVTADTESSAKKIMKEMGKHKVDDVMSLVEYIKELDTPSEKELQQAIKKPVCLEAGT